MKKFFIGLTSLMIVASCKKGKNPEPDKPEKITVTTFAGTGGQGFINGPALTAEFHFPEDIVIDANGKIFVTDALNHAIRKIDGGVVSTFAGGNATDIINGNGTNASFKAPFSITIDGNGNMYTTDENDPRIRKITPNGDVTTYAGTANYGFKDGKADEAQFYFGNNIVVDPQGNVYISEGSSNRIRKVSVNGDVTTIAGTGVPGFKNGNGSEAQFSIPGGITIDKQGNLYVIDRGNYRIRKITPGGLVSTFAGSGTDNPIDGKADEVGFSIDTHDILVKDNGDVYIQDERRIRRISNGMVTTLAGTTRGFADGDGPGAKFDYLSGFTFDAQGNIYTADLSNNRIRKITFTK